MSPKFTFELELSAFSSQNLKNKMIAWLQEQDITSFVEGIADGLDLDFSLEDQDQLAKQSEQLMASSPISLFSFDKEYLEDIRQRALVQFPELESAIKFSLTQSWMDGWKDSFKPISTKSFYIYPPWDESLLPYGKHPIVIEPGMAFGTGQHATTRLCLNAFENLISNVDAPSARILDIGTGTGILAIAAKKTGIFQVEACDVEQDSIAATKENAQMNAVSLDRLWLGSADKSHGVYQIIFANILAPVILQLLETMSRHLDPKGFMILSGLLHTQKAEILEKAFSLGLVLEKEFSEDKDDWVALVVKKAPLQ